MTTAEQIDHHNTAQELYKDSLNAGFSYGCFEISLRFLGATDITLADINREGREPAPLLHAIEKHGMRVNWMVTTNVDVDSEDIEALLGETISFEEECPEGEVAGYLWVGHVPDKVLHAMAVVPDGSENYQVMDTESGGKHTLSSENLASAIHDAISQGGSYDIAQIKRGVQRKNLSL
jgi:hypothetical protein